MAQPRRFNTAAPLTILDTKKALTAKSEVASGKLFVALFNTEFSEGRTVENKLKACRQHYETNYGMEFYKYIITKGKQEIKTDFQINDTPTVIFYRDGTEVGRIEDFEEADPSNPPATNDIPETEDEKKLKNKLDELSKPK